jgi:hypothetical protein
MAGRAANDVSPALSARLNTPSHRSPEREGQDWRLRGAFACERVKKGRPGRPQKVIWRKMLDRATRAYATDRKSEITFAL